MFNFLSRLRPSNIAKCFRRPSQCTRRFSSFVSPAQSSVEVGSGWLISQWVKKIGKKIQSYDAFLFMVVFSYLGFSVVYDFITWKSRNSPKVHLSPPPFLSLSEKPNATLLEYVSHGFGFSDSEKIDQIRTELLENKNKKERTPEDESSEKLKPILLWDEWEKMWRFFKYRPDNIFRNYAPVHTYFPELEQSKYQKVRNTVDSSLFHLTSLIYNNLPPEVFEFMGKLGQMKKELLDDGDMEIIEEPTPQPHLPFLNPYIFLPPPLPHNQPLTILLGAVCLLTVRWQW
eukprot:TRINITY_DN3861_c0_g1_i13.p1 TRINITY_DN3861_c0_g1~~TRINITY_DN3861_c0_g1_i13.p1  ORF type:complete len:287 (+),score=32.85 TRINITY_DN3861_c0_g1_i13:461-1321(+)